MKNTRSKSRVSEYPQFFAICKVHKLDYKEVVAEFSGYKTESLRELTDSEFEELMGRLLVINASTRIKWNENRKPDVADKMRKKMYAIAKQMRWGSTTQSLGVGAALDQWCLKQKYKKKLGDHSIEELGILLTIFEQKVYSDYLKGLNK